MKHVSEHANKEDLVECVRAMASKPASKSTSKKK